MSNSGISEQIISLPKSGGAIQSIGEKFQVNLNKGTGNFSIPLSLPANRNDITPQLSLDYNTGNGNGIFGMGWALSIPMISRKTSKGIPQYRDSSKNEKDWDTYVLSGAEDLVLIDITQTGANNDVIHYYQPRTEGLFARIIHITGKGHDYWEVTLKNGIKSFYGLPGEISEGKVFDKENPSHIFSWRLCMIEDTYGNTIHYKYKRENNTLGYLYENNHDHNQLYLCQVLYGNYDQQSIEKFFFSVTFDYGEFEDDETNFHQNPNPVKKWNYRPDPFSFNKAAFEIRTIHRCRRIIIKIHDKNHESGQLIRSYRIVYKDELSYKKASRHSNKASLIHSVQLIGYREDGGNYTSEKMPAVQFDYTDFVPEEAKFESLDVELNKYPERSLADGNFELIDLFGNGLPDIISTYNNEYRVWRNNGNSYYAPKTMDKFPAGVELKDQGVEFADMTGNGSADLLVSQGLLSGYFETNYDGTWQNYFSFPEAPSFNLEDPDVHMFDLTGDGVTDVCIITAEEILFYRNLGKNGWDKPRIIRNYYGSDNPSGISLSSTANNIRIADMTGDGLKDICLIHSDRIDYWPNLGYGRFGKPIRMHNSPALGADFDPSRLFISDLDGDGCADVVYVNSNSVDLWINNQGNAFSNKITIYGTPACLPGSVRIADMKGRGVGGILWSYNYGDIPGSNLRFLDLTGGAKPYLLSNIDNNLGSKTKIEYETSTNFYINDRNNGCPWKTNLPFPVQCISRVTTFDYFSKGKLTSEFYYSHGCWDSVELEFTGFGKVIQRDTESFAQYNFQDVNIGFPFHGVEEQYYSPPVEIRTWFHLGAVGTNIHNTEEITYDDEYWSGDKQELHRPDTVQNYLDSLPLKEKRDAIRSLRGAKLRVEIYGLDDSVYQHRPYVVSEYLHGLEEKISPNNSGTGKPCIFFPYAIAERNTKWERGYDPMTAITFTGNYDQYGQARLRLDVAVPYGRPYMCRLASAATEHFLATRTNTVYAIPDDPDTYIYDRVANVIVHQIKDDLHSSVFELWDAVYAGMSDLIPDNSLQPEIVSQVVNKFDGLDFQGAAVGRVINHGALMYSESLVLTDKILTDAYATAKPPYLSPGNANWTAEYPQEFRTLASKAGYIFYNPGNVRIGGYYAIEIRNSYNDKGLITAQQDPLGNQTDILYDEYFLFPIRVTGSAPASLENNVIYDYQTLKPRTVTNANDKITIYYYTPLGLLKEIFLPPDQNRPSTQFSYDFNAFLTHKQPVYSHKKQYIWHDSDLVGPGIIDEASEIREYSDGFGRILQLRVLTESKLFGDASFGNGVLDSVQSALPANQEVTGQSPPAGVVNVIISGWKYYNNKGKVVEAFESLYSTGWDFTPETAINLGQKSRLEYDGIDRLFRSTNPDGSQIVMIYGSPLDISDPCKFVPTPWTSYTYDTNDNAARTLGAANANNTMPGHHDTPSSVHVDCLGRVIERVVRNGHNPLSDWYSTKTEYDIKGNVLRKYDENNRKSFEYVYDLKNNQLKTEHLDGGIKRNVFDASGNLIEHRSSKDSIVLKKYDELNRPARIWARDITGEQLTLRELIIYGDDSGAGIANPKSLNLLGNPYKYYDEAGLLLFESYDFKGRLLNKQRRVISDNELARVFSGASPVNAYRVNWSPPSGISFSDRTESILENKIYRTAFSYDTLDRVWEITYPEDVDSERKMLIAEYNLSGALKTLRFDGKDFVKHTAYNARGQRTMVALGNEVITRYAYDDTTFSLVRLRTENYVETNPHTYRLSGYPLQEYGYEYDLARNIVAIHDLVKGSGTSPTPDELHRSFGYDPLYRVIYATGRECDVAMISPPWSDSALPRCDDPVDTRSYEEHYSYDRTGNLEKLEHRWNGNKYERMLHLEAGTNRISKLNVTNGISTDYQYRYDSNGNLTQEGTDRYFEWDHSDHMRVYKNQTGDTDPAVYTHYLYDSAGMRIKKYVRNNGITETVVYIDSLFEVHKVTGASDSENNLVHIMDGAIRVGTMRIGPAFVGDNMPAIQYILNDHLGSSTLLLDDAGDLLNKEEFTPYGETSFGSHSYKKFRYSGEEQDKEHKLYYYGARYYSPYLCRWLSCDPMANTNESSNLYSFVSGKVINLVDQHGMYEVAPDTAQNRQIESEIGSRIVELFEDSQTRNAIKGEGFDFGAWTLKRAQYKQETQAGINIRLRPFGNDSPNYNILNPHDPGPNAEYRNHTYCTAVTWQYALLAIEQINREEGHFSFGRIGGGRRTRNSRLIRFQQIWYRINPDLLGAPQALEYAGLGYRVNNIRTGLHPGAVVNYYGSRRPGGTEGHSIIFLKYDQSFETMKFLRNIVYGIFAEEEISSDKWFDRSGIVAISQGNEDTYSFGKLERKGAIGDNWLPTRAQVD